MAKFIPIEEIGPLVDELLEELLKTVRLLACCKWWGGSKHRIYRL